MTGHAQAIVEFLKLNPETYYSRKEISKKAIHRDEYEENPHWATMPLHILVEQGELEENESGHYRIKDKNYQSKFDKKY